MGRLVQLLLLIALAVIAWRLLRRALAPPPPPPPPREDPAAFEPTARCARCGTHVPRAQLDAAGACARCRT